MKQLIYFIVFIAAVMAFLYREDIAAAIIDKKTNDFFNYKTF